MPSSKIILVLLSVVLLSCSRPPELVGVDNLSQPVGSVEQAHKHKIFIATTRRSTEVIGAFYSGKREPELGFASVLVSIPPNHMPGQIERPKNLPPDPREEFAIIEPTVFGSDSSFVRSLNHALAQLPRQDRKILLFVHGYNNTISDSILRIAQFVEDTDFNGVPVLFSWASAAKTTHYVYDMNSALIARPKLMETANILGRTNATGFNLLAHSMGAMLAMEAIVQANLAGTFNPSGRLENILLAAPDIDLDLFRSQISQIPKSSQGYFVLVSKNDKALGFSERISGGVERVGSADAEELKGLGVTVIDVTEIDDSASGTHSKFAGSPEIVQLIGGAMNAGQLGQGKRTNLAEMLSGIPINFVRPN
ncbi:MAG: alpha/beta hydrolase [Paracoccaceae bacterium]